MLTLYLIYYFIAIYGTIAAYAFLKKSASRQSIMLALHIVLTVPASYFLSGYVLKALNGLTSFLYSLLVTVGLCALALLLSGVVVRQISRQGSSA